MIINGAKVTISKSAQEVFEFFMKLENFEQLMPDSIQKFLAEEESFLFALKGMPEIRLVLQEKTAFSKVVLGSASSKLSFRLTVNIEALSENSSEVEFNFKGDFNPMTAMMVKKPLTSLINTLTDHTAKL